MLVHLTRSVSKKSSVQIAKNNLEKAVRRVLRKFPAIKLRTLSVCKNSSGYSATLEVDGKLLEDFSETLRERLVTAFDPPWLVVQAGHPANTPTPGGVTPSVAVPEPGQAPPPKAIGDVNLSFPVGTFDRIYGREAQIRRIVDALSLGAATGWTKRKHTLLSGPPGCGKSETMLALARALGREGEAWIWFDATSTTRAGAVEQLLGAKTIPPVLFIEEIEKTQESALRWLLGVMDERGEVRRTNYRVGNQQRAVRLAIVATANSVDLLRQMDGGALYSRFSNEIEFPPPDREVMAKILSREIAEVPGASPAWVQAALEFGFDLLGIRDPRSLLNITLCGRDRLLDGSYQHDYLATTRLRRGEVVAL
jgi:Mrp family chromosome partitioning ATPase